MLTLFVSSKAAAVPMWCIAEEYACCQAAGLSDVVMWIITCDNITCPRALAP